MEQMHNKVEKKISFLFEEAASLKKGLVYWKDNNNLFLGGNKRFLGAFGYESNNNVIGKSDHDIWPSFADKYIADDNDVINAGKKIGKEYVFPSKDGHERRCFITRAPLYDENDDIAGVIVKVDDLTCYESVKPYLIQKDADRTFEYLYKVSQIIPTPIYWFSLDSVVLGGNDTAVRGISGSTIDDFIGKTPYDYYPHDVADEIVDFNNEVVRSGEVISREEVVTDVVTHEKKYVRSIKAPLYNDDDLLIGIVGVSFDITGEKEATFLKLESELQKSQLLEQRKFKKMVDQVVHDIRSPLASLLMIVKSCVATIPEDIRIALREAATSIDNIANNLLHGYDDDYPNVGLIKTEEMQDVMLSLVLLQVLNEKKLQYKESSVKFGYEFSPGCGFVFIHTELMLFKRMMSNLLNNAVEALEGIEGNVLVNIKLEGRFIKIILLDEGKGMKQEVIDKIINHTPVSDGKKQGHGIGFPQILETLERSKGEIDIKSKIGEGTKITLTLPMVESPEWIASEIRINKGDTVVILDDDSSIHRAWAMQFRDYLDDISLQHFTLAYEAVEFINNFPSKEKIFLLSDFELLRQEINGVEVIERVNVGRSILVTSHYANLAVCNLAVKNRTKVLPKPLASDVPIKIDDGVNDSADGYPGDGFKT